MKSRKHMLTTNLVHIIMIVMGVILFGLAAVNFVYSQNIPPLYFNVINEDKGSIITYLINIKNTSLFSREFLRYKNMYGGWIENEVFRVEKERNQKIQALEEVLNKNQQSRDVLYELSILYKEKGDVQKAQEYYQRAKAIDPSI